MIKSQKYEILNYNYEISQNYEILNNYELKSQNCDIKSQNYELMKS